MPMTWSDLQLPVYYHTIIKQTAFFINICIKLNLFLSGMKQLSQEGVSLSKTHWMSQQNDTKDKLLWKYLLLK